MKQPIQRQSEGGYAILAILLGAVLISVFLVQALPREAMSAQRIREQRLIDHGEEYARAIKLYFRENKKYPQEIDDLEDTNGVRYLRRRYKDPMTGEEEWRLIHVGVDGRFKDSLIYDTEDPEEMSADGRMGAGGSGFGGGGSSLGGGSSFGGGRSSGLGNRQNTQGGPMDAATYQAMYGAPPPPQPGVFQGASIARQVRQSAAPDNPLQQQNQRFSMEGDQAGANGGEPLEPGLGPDGRPLPIDQQQPVDYSNLPPGQVPPDAGQRQQPGANPQPGQAGYSLPRSRAGIGQRPGAVPPQPAGGQPAGFGTANISGDAASVIGRLLTTPRPGGLAGIQGMAGAQQQQAGQGQAFQEGIAGVASKAEQVGVKVYKGENNYKQWEFVYDYRQDTGMGGMPGQQQQGPGNINPNQPGLSAGGGLSGNPGGFQQFPGMGGAPVGVPPVGAPPYGVTPPQPNEAPPVSNPADSGQEPVQPQDGNPPIDPTQPYPTDTPGVDVANPTEPPPTRPSRTYQLPRTRTIKPNQ